jgi:hypothetical protein
MSSDFKTVTGARFAEMTDIEKRMLGLDTGPKPVREFLDARALAKEAAEQKTALGALTRVAQERDGKIAALDKELPADVRGRRAREIAATYEPLITKLKSEIDGRASLAEQNRSSFDLRGVAARGRLSVQDHEHAAIATMWSAKLGRLITPHIVDYVASVAGQGPAAAAYTALVLDELDARESEPEGSVRHVSRKQREQILTALEGVPSINTEMRAGHQLINEIALGAREALLATGQGTARDKIAVGLLKGDLQQ